jgi:hypothetical protein
MGGALLNFVAEGKWEGETHREGVIEDEYDYAVRIIGDVCMRHVEGWRGTHGVTSTSFPARKGSRMQRRGSLSLSCGRPIYAVSAQTASVMQRKNRTSSYASRLLMASPSQSDQQENDVVSGRTAVSSIVLSSSSTFPPGSAVSPA